MHRSGAAEDYPSRPVRLIVDSAPGSGVDMSARIIAEGLSRRPMSPAETLAFIHREQQRWAPIVKQIIEMR